VSDWHLAPSLVQLRNEVDQRWPHRSKKSDGTIGDAAHAARKSDHNPNGRKSVNAIDITYPGVDSRAIIAACKKHPSCAYVIFNGFIYSRTTGFAKVPYTGASPHKEHLHISILQTVAAENNKTRWLAPVTPKPIAPKPTDKPAMPKYPGGSGYFRVGQKGEHVRLVQTFLGHNVTGTMAPIDVLGVKKFQRRRPWLWPADGIVGPYTYNAMCKSTRVKNRYK